jgi:hypothetical protein
VSKPYTTETRVRLAKERGILVDEQDMWLIEAFTWSVDNYGYVYTAYMGKPMKLHHCIAGNPIWEGDQIDHINRNKQDNRRSNLRYVDNDGNRMNNRDIEHARLVYPINKGGFVFRVRRRGVAHTEFYKTEAQAIAARDRWLATQELIK